MLVHLVPVLPNVTSFQQTQAFHRDIYLPSHFRFTFCLLPFGLTSPSGHEDVLLCCILKALSSPPAPPATFRSLIPLGLIFVYSTEFLNRGPTAPVPFVEKSFFHSPPFHICPLSSLGGICFFLLICFTSLLDNMSNLEQFKSTLISFLTYILSCILIF